MEEEYLYEGEEVAPKWSTDIANVIKAATPTISKIIHRERSSSKTFAPVAPHAPEEKGSTVFGIPTKTVLFAAAGIAIIYLLTRKK